MATQEEESWKVSEMRAMLSAAGVDLVGVTEKGEMRRLTRELLQTQTTARQAAAPLPPRLAANAVLPTPPVPRRGSTSVEKLTGNGPIIASPD
jgi:hypothetical protein